MADIPEKLTPRQSKVLNALLQHGTVLGAAKASGVGSRTIHRYLTEDETFQSAYHEAQKQQLNIIQASLQTHCHQATSILLEIMGDRSQPPSVRVSAAKSILEHGLRRPDSKTSEAEIENRIRQEHEAEIEIAAKKFEDLVYRMAERKRLAAQNEDGFPKK